MGVTRDWGRDERLWGGSAPPPAGIGSPQIAKGSIPKIISQTIRAGCTPMAMPGSRIFIVQAACTKSPAWPTSDESLSTSTKLKARPSQMKRSGALRNSMRSRRKRGGRHQIGASISGKQGRSRSLTIWKSGCMPDCPTARLPGISGKSPLVGAIRYALTRMARLRFCLDHGILELDNDTAERAMRSVAIGRKNHLFVGSQTGGKAAAIAYTLIEIAKLNGINPQAWLADTLARIPDCKINRVDDLLPWKTTQ